MGAKSGRSGGLPLPHDDDSSAQASAPPSPNEDAASPRTVSARGLILDEVGPRMRLPRYSPQAGAEEHGAEQIAAQATGEV